MSPARSHSQGLVYVECEDIQNAILLYSLCSDCKAKIDGQYAIHPSYVERVDASESSCVEKAEETVDVCVDGRTH